jgi:hypothetical protein
MNSEDIQLHKETERFADRVFRLYMSFYQRVWKLPEVVRYFEKGSKPFWIDQHKDVSRALEKPLTQLTKSIEGMINTGIQKGEDLGISKYDRIKLAATQRSRAQSAARKLMGRTSLSERVWKITNGTKAEIELLLQNAMKEGKSADQLSREVRKYLNEPDRQFKAVKNKETGKYELSEAAKKYKPGKGVYRSSYKNAMRLVRTEMTAAMRYSLWKNIQKDPLIIGFRIALSNNQLNGMPCPVCEALAGDYPKSFLWTGWHPQCRCIMTPITISNEELTKYIRAKDNGDVYTPKQITSLPQNFTKWWNANGPRFYQEGASKPYWLLDNEATFQLQKVAS